MIPWARRWDRGTQGGSVCKHVQRLRCTDDQSRGNVRGEAELQRGGDEIDFVIMGDGAR